MRRALLCVLTTVLISAPLLPIPTSAASTDIVINEIAAYQASDHEWFEIFNKGTSPVDLTGWKFFEDNTNHSLAAFRGDLIIDPGEYAVIADVAANTAADYPAFTGTLIDSSWNTLTETGEPIALKDNTGAVVEQFTYASAANHSLERKDATLTDYTASNWIEHASGNTIGAINSNAISQTTPPPDQTTPPPTETTPPSTTTPPPTQTQTPAPTTPKKETTYYSRGDMYINEFVSDPGDDDIEWIELYNPGIQDIDLTGWTIEDGSKTKTTLSGMIGSNANNRFFVVENPKGKLNNAGDLIILKDPNGGIIDDLAYGDWDDGNTDNNAPAPKDPSCTARLKDGENTYNNAFDFKVTTKPTKGSSNVIIDPDNPSTAIKIPFIKDIIISELLPDPIGPDTKNEFIELYNQGDTDINLAGWEIVNGAGRKYIVDDKKIKNLTIKAHGYFVLDRSVTGLALKNTGGDEVRLYQPDGEKPNATANYKEKTVQGQSYAFFGSDGYSWTTTPTPAAANIKTLANQAPDPDLNMPTTGSVLEELVFDASDSTDPEQDSLTYTWDFGDGQKGDGVVLTHHFEKAGRYKVSLTVSDGKNKKIETKTIAIKAATQTENLDAMSQIPPEEVPQSILGISPIVISEVSPNPKGADTNEFVSLANISNVPVDISGWRITFALGKKSYTFPDGTMMEAGGHIVLTPQTNKISLRNAADTITLYDSNGNFMDVISYEDAPEGQHLTRTKEGDFVWVAANLSGPQTLLSDIEIETVSTTTKKKTSKTSKTKSVAMTAIQTTLEHVRELPIDTLVQVQGVVSSAPGVLGANIFYLAGSGIQVYASQANMPRLAVGDRVKLQGTLSQISNESRIKVSSTDAISFLSHGTPPVPHQIQTGQINEDYEGSLVSVSGEVVKTQWPSIYIDDGTDEARVYVKESTGIPHMKIDKGSTLHATGVVSQTTSGYRLLPRSKDDLIVSAPAKKDDGSVSTGPADQGTLSLSPATDAPVPIAQIGVVSAFGVAFLAGSMVIQRKSNKK